MPIIKPLPLVSSSARLTLLPGEFSTRTSMFGILSPTLIKARAELWNDLVGRAAARANRRRAVVDAMTSAKVNVRLELKWLKGDGVDKARWGFSLTQQVGAGTNFSTLELELGDTTML